MSRIPKNKSISEAITEGLVINPAHICWAHNLLQTFPSPESQNNPDAKTPISKSPNLNNPNTILFLEEWNFLLHNKVCFYYCDYDYC